MTSSSALTWSIAPPDQSSRRILGALLLIAASACAADTTGAPAAPPDPPAATTTVLPLAWPATVPKHGDLTSALSQGFAEFDDVSARKYHTGLDIRAESASTVTSAGEGWIELLEKNTSRVCGGGSCDHNMGNTLILGHALVDGRTIYTQYSHMLDWPASDPILTAVVKKCAAIAGDVRWSCARGAVAVSRRQPIGTVGGTGGGGTPWPAHLHFEVKQAAVLSTNDNDVVTGDDGWGYRGKDPAGSAFYDPMLFFHPDATPFSTPRPLRLANGTTQLLIRMGPSGEGVGSSVVAYRAMNVFTSSVELQAVAATSIASGGSCQRWYRVVRADGTMIHDQQDPDPYQGRYGDAPSGWVCADFVTETVPSSTLVVGYDGLSGTSAIYQVELGANGIDRQLSSIKSSGGESLFITDIALNANGVVYGISFSALYQIDRQTGIATSLGAMPVTDANALAVSAVGDLYTLTVGGQLLRRANGSQGWINVGSTGLSSSGDLAFAPTGELYGTVTSFFGSDRLVRIDPATAKATVISPSDGIGAEQVYGLAFAGRTLYGLAQVNGAGRLLQIDVASGRATVVRDIAFAPSGAADRVGR